MVDIGDKTKMSSKLLRPIIVPATYNDYPVIQNMARFYVYDLSRYCGFISEDWSMPANGLYECFDFRIYFEDENRWPFLIKLNSELAGFILVDKETKESSSNWNMGEFFVIAKFQNKGIAREAAWEVFNKYSGIWEVSVIPENHKGLNFWKRVIGTYTNGKFSCQVKVVDFDKYQPHRHIFTFDTKIFSEN